MSKTFGKASDFYRVRIITLEQELPPDFDWRNDVLYRSPKESFDMIKRTYCLQVVELDSRNYQALEEYSAKQAATQEKAIVEEDIINLTKMEFEKKYEINFSDNSTLSIDGENVIEEKKEDNTNVPRNLS